MIYTAIYYSVASESFSKSIVFVSSPTREEAWKEALENVEPFEELICIIPGRHDTWTPDLM